MFTAFKKLLYVDQKQQRAKNAPPRWKSDLDWQQGELHISNSGLIAGNDCRGEIQTTGWLAY